MTRDMKKTTEEPAFTMDELVKEKERAMEKEIKADIDVAVSK